MLIVGAYKQDEVVRSDLFISPEVPSYGGTKRSSPWLSSARSWPVRPCTLSYIIWNAPFESGKFGKGGKAF